MLLLALQRHVPVMWQKHRLIFASLFSFGANILYYEVVYSVMVIFLCLFYICTFFIYNKISSYTTYYIDYVFPKKLFLEKIMQFLDQFVCRNLKITKGTSKGTVSLF